MLEDSDIDRDDLARQHRSQVNCPVAKRQFHLPAAHNFRERLPALKHLVDAASLRIIDRLAAVEGQPVAALDTGDKIDHDAAAADSADSAESHAALRA